MKRNKELRLSGERETTTKTWGETKGTRVMGREQPGCAAAGRVGLHSEEAKRSEGKKPINGLKGKYPSSETEG